MIIKLFNLYIYIHIQYMYIIYTQANKTIDLKNKIKKQDDCLETVVENIQLAIETQKTIKNVSD